MLLVTDLYICKISVIKSSLNCTFLCHADELRFCLWFNCCQLSIMANPVFALKDKETDTRENPAEIQDYFKVAHWDGCEVHCESY